MSRSASAVVFHPIEFVGFNKIQRIERNLAAAGFIGSQFRSSSAFTTGAAYRQFLPKEGALQKYQYSLIRIHLQSVGQWFWADQLGVRDRSNLVIIEGDSSLVRLRQGEALCKLLEDITGDRYRGQWIDDLTCLGIKECPPEDYAPC